MDKFIFGQWRFITAVDYGVIYSDQYETKQQSLLAWRYGAFILSFPFFLHNY